MASLYMHSHLWHQWHQPTSELQQGRRLSSQPSLEDHCSWSKQTERMPQLHSMYKALFHCLIHLYHISLFQLALSRAIQEEKTLIHSLSLLLLSFPLPFPLFFHFLLAVSSWHAPYMQVFHWTVDQYCKNQNGHWVVISPSRWRQ